MLIRYAKVKNLWHLYRMLEEFAMMLLGYEMQLWAMIMNCIIDS